MCNVLCMSNYKWKLNWKEHYKDDALAFLNVFNSIGVENEPCIIHDRRDSDSILDRVNTRNLLLRPIRSQPGVHRALHKCSEEPWFAGEKKNNPGEYA